MSLELATYSGDRRMTLSIAEVIRKPVWGDDWTRVRIGIQFNFPGATAYATTLAGTPALAFGVCSGDSSGFGAGVSGSTTHAMGVYTKTTSWTYSSTSFATGSTHAGFKKAGTTVTNSTNTWGTTVLTGLDTVRNGLFVELTKTTSTSMTMQIGRPTSSAAANSDLTDAKFLEIMELAAGMSSIGTSKTGYQVTTLNAVAFDEGANGTLDHIFVQWDKSTLPLSFNLRHRLITA